MTRLFTYNNTLDIDVENKESIHMYGQTHNKIKIITFLSIKKTTKFGQTCRDLCVIVIVFNISS